MLNHYQEESVEKSTYKYKNMCVHCSTWANRRNEQGPSKAKQISPHLGLCGNSTALEGVERADQAQGWLACGLQTLPIVRKNNPKEH